MIDIMQKKCYSKVVSTKSLHRAGIELTYGACNGQIQIE